MELTIERINYIKSQKSEENALLDKKFKYYRGEHEAILARKKDPDLKNNKIVVNHCKRIVDINAGALFSQPVQYQAEESIDISPILAEFEKQTIQRLDLTNGKRTGIAGKSYEYIYAKENEDGGVDIRSVLTDPRNSFIKYDSSIEQNKVYGVFWSEKDEETGNEEWTIVDDVEINIYYFNVSNKTLTLDEDRSSTHLFGKMPMIEYLNNEEAQGDFEQAMSLNDALNMLQSDRINDKEQLVSAILYFTGAMVDDEDMESVKSDRVLMLPDGASAGYLTKPMDEASVEVLKTSLVDDIYTVTMTPNLSDEKFAGNASGVALELKLIPFIQNIDNKKNFMSKGMDERFEIYSNILTALGRMSQVVRADQFDIIFRHNLPQNKLEAAQIVGLLWGKVDRATLLSWLPDVRNAEEIIDALEADEEAARQKFGMNDFGVDNDGEENE